MTAPDLSSNNAKIVSSAGSNTMQIPGDIVSPPYHHVHSRKSSTPVTTHLKSQYVDTRHTSPKKSSSIYQHAAPVKSSTVYAFARPFACCLNYSRVSTPTLSSPALSTRLLDHARLSTPPLSSLALSTRSLDRLRLPTTVCALPRPFVRSLDHLSVGTPTLSSLALSTCSLDHSNSGIEVIGLLPLTPRSSLPLNRLGRILYPCCGRHDSPTHFAILWTQRVPL